MILLSSSLVLSRDDPDNLFAARLLKPARQSSLFDAIALALGAKAPVGPGEAVSSESRAIASGLRVLIADDNDVNRNIAHLVLRRFGAEPDEVDNGRDAVERVNLAATGRGYDLVLMDVQMPGMDGYEATAAIRAAADGPNAVTPIVAVTAHALSSDRERCLAAGMNAFVSKPVRPDTLLATIDGLFDGHRAAPPAPRRRPAQPRPAAIDRAALLAAFGDDRGLLDETIGVFLADAPAQLDALRRAVAAEDAPAITRAAHALKGAVSLFSLAAPYTSTRALEAAARAGVPDRLPARLAAVERAVTRLMAGLSALRPDLARE
jgi:two-component system sensor histidine kinase/response regulator